MRTVLAILMIGLVASPALAILDDGINSLGVYFDSDGNIDCLDPPTLFVTHNMYFIVAHPTPANLSGYEFAWRFDPPIEASAIVMETVLPPGAMNIGKENSLLVSFANGLVTAEATVLARCTFILLDTVPTETYITVGPATPARLPGHAAILGAMEPGLTVMALRENGGAIDAEGWAVPGVASLDCLPHGEPVDPATWGGIKALYR